MITVNLKIENKIKKVNIYDEVLFNTLLANNLLLIKKLVKSVCPGYKINGPFFGIVNNFVDFSNQGVSLYAGLIVRTDLNEYVVLYLQDSILDEKYMLKLIDDYIKEIGDYRPTEVNVNKIEIKKEAFLKALAKL